MKISATKDKELIKQNSSGLFLGIVFVVLLIGILALSLWLNELSRESQKINAGVESRLLILEEQLQLADSTSTEFLSDINTQLQFLDKEIRKLWDLSNKRNKVNIAKLSKDFKSQSSELKELALTQTNDQKNINRIKSKLEKLEILVSDITKSNQQNLAMQTQLAELNKNILLLEETVQAFDTYRKQNNEMLREMQLQIANLKLTPQLEN
ncbi:MAG: hypothetical protein P8L73_05995 [SAR86 cluster bacterium]|nr:hypothetical protein [SAR86 cluster bacterium]